MSRIADVFVACDAAVERRVPLRPPDANSAGSPFQNWFEDCLRHAGLEARTLGSRNFPDFVFGDDAEGFELKGLEVPGRDKSFDANSQLPKGRHNGREIYYVFGRYKKHAVAERSGLIDLAVVHGDVLSLDTQPLHKNTSVRGAGSYGDFLIRMRKMYVPPTPYAILNGITERRTLVVPDRLNATVGQDRRLRRVGTLERRETERVIVGISVDLHRQGLEVRTEPNPAAGTVHTFHAYRAVGADPDPVTLRDMSAVPSTVLEELDPSSQEEDPT